MCITDRIQNAIARMPRIGSVCRCHRNILGIVTKLPTCTRCACTALYEGVTLDGKPWQSVRPILVALTVEEYIGQRLKEYASDNDRPSGEE